MGKAKIKLGRDLNGDNLCKRTIKRALRTKIQKAQKDLF